MGDYTLDRRSLLLGAFGLVLPKAGGASSRLETLTDWLGADRKTREQALAETLKYIEAQDSSIHAWVQVLPQKAVGSGQLLGIPYGAKDVIETRGLATEFGSPIYRGRTGATDAAIIQTLRSRGAILLGKTHTAAFAHQDPPPTHNPRDLEHTPGGSSSGSAAAVAAGMVPFALGTQTGGSTLRPASYCGVTGFKPTFGLFSLDGVMQYARSLDTIGFFTHTPADMLRLWEALGRPTGKQEQFVIGVPESLPAVVEPEMAAAFQNTVSHLRRNGVVCRPVDISGILSKLVDAQHIIAAYEGARAQQERFKQYGDRLGKVATMVREGLQMTDTQYDGAVRFISEIRMQILEMYKVTPVIIVPAATGPAPLGLTSTGDSKMNSPWTALGTPAISIPMPVGNALPLGLQLTAAPGHDAQVLQTAERLHRILNAQ